MSAWKPAAGGRNLGAGSPRFCDEFEGGFGWVVDEFMERCSHAFVVEGRVWLIDPVAADGVIERVTTAGEAVGVVQLLDRHNRDGAALAAALGVPHHVVPRELAPFRLIPIRAHRRWNEVALWWDEQRILVCADVLGTARYYRARRDRLAVHPLLRLAPPRRQLGALAPERILCGHGEGIARDADGALREALSTARRRIPGQLASAARAWRGG
jgi:hypothetical protein